MKKYFLVFLILGTCYSAYSQKEKIKLNLGYGYYESLCFGMQYDLREKFRLGLLFGHDFSIVKNSKYYSVSVDGQLAVFKDKKYSKNNYKWYVTGKIMYWDFEDKYYRFNVLSFSPALTRNIFINDKFSFSCDIGPLFTIVLESYRKTFEEVGWPYHVMPNFRILMNYQL